MIQLEQDPSAYGFFMPVNPQLPLHIGSAEREYFSNPPRSCTDGCLGVPMVPLANIDAWLSSIDQRLDRIAESITEQRLLNEQFISALEVIQGRQGASSSRVHGDQLPNTHVQEVGVKDEGRCIYCSGGHAGINCRAHSLPL